MAQGQGTTSRSRSPLTCTQRSGSYGTSSKRCGSRSTSTSGGRFPKPEAEAERLPHHPVRCRPELPGGGGGRGSGFNASTSISQIQSLSATLQVFQALSGLRASCVVSSISQLDTSAVSAGRLKKTLGSKKVPGQPMCRPQKHREPVLRLTFTLKAGQLVPSHAAPREPELGLKATVLPSSYLEVHGTYLPNITLLITHL